MDMHTHTHTHTQRKCKCKAWYDGTRPSRALDKVGQTVHDLLHIDPFRRASSSLSLSLSCVRA